MINIETSIKLNKEARNLLKKACKFEKNIEKEVSDTIILLEKKQAIAYNFIENDILVGLAIVQFFKNKNEFYIRVMTLEKHGIFKSIYRFLENKAIKLGFDSITVISARKGYLKRASEYGFIVTGENDNFIEYKKEI